MIRKVMFFCFFILVSASWAIPAYTTTYFAELQLIDESTGDPVSGAAVQFGRPGDEFIARQRPASQMATADPSRPGVYHYTFNVDHGAIGRDILYIMSITKQGFQELKTSVTLTQWTETLKRLTLTMKRELGRGQAVHITVKRTNSDDPVYQAWVMICNQSGKTDANGRITLQFNEPVGGDGYCGLTIRQDTFNSIEGDRIRISMYDDDARHQSITCRLKSVNITTPGAPESGCGPPTKSAMSPEEQQRRFLKVRVTVTDRSDASLASDKRPMVGGASLSLTLTSGSAVAGTEISSGVYEFTLDPDKDAGKNGTLTFKKRGFRDVTTLVSGSQLIPGNQPIAVYMETDKRDMVKEVVDALIADVNKKLEALYRTCDSFHESENQVPQYKEAISLLASGYARFKSLMENAQRECATIPSLHGEIRTLVNSAKNSEATLRLRVDQANHAAARCRTRADADRLEALWNEIRRLSWEVHLNGGKAEGLNNRLKGIISRGTVLRNRFDHADADVPVPLNQLPVKAQEILNALRILRSSGAFGQAYQQVRNKRREAVQAYSEAINKVDSYLDPADLTDPRVTAFKNRMRAQMAALPKACDEESSRESLDRYLNELAKGVQGFPKTIQDLKTKYPLCIGEKTEDALIMEVQGRERESIMTLVMGSDIPTKIQTCRANAASTTTAKPTPPASKSPDDDGDGVPNNRDKCPGTPVGHPVDTDGCSLLQRFAKADMKIEGPESIKAGQPTWYKAKGDNEFTSLLSGLTGSIMYRWYVEGKEVARGTENFQYNLPVGSEKDKITIMVRLFWVNTRTMNEVPVKDAQRTIGVLSPTPGQPTKKKYGPFSVPWGSWFPTGVAIKKGEGFSVKAKGAYVNPEINAADIGPDGGGRWNWFRLKAKIGNQLVDVGSSGGATATQDGTIELGSPRGNEFHKEDAKNHTGSLSVEVWVEEKSKR